MAELGCVGATTANSAVDRQEDATWTTVVKKKPKMKKNLLVVKSNDENVKAVEKKEEVSQALNGTQITDTRFTEKGNMVINFENEEMRD